MPPNGEFFPDSTYSSKSNNLQEPSNQRQPPASVRNGIGSRRGYPRKRKAVLSSRDDREFGNRTRTTDHDGSNVINEENSIHKPGGSGTGGGLIPVKEGESQNLLIRKGSENRGSLNGCTSGVSNSQLRGETSRQILDFSEPLNSLNVARHKGPHKSLGHRDVITKILRPLVLSQSIFNAYKFQEWGQTISNALQIAGYASAKHVINIGGFILRTAFAI
ncbi:unnamed protein product [Protopolystoma xenopodis]|uniref:Uncharacterized protein n=1 Tax=Protopolystoma xenopodis TaxID=117903 RepID=A0A3S4ZHI9_9PLAT|nr:unnamed protein product [Protopolystoma xenopodis]